MVKEVFRKRVRIMNWDNIVGINSRIQYEFSTATGEVTKKAGLYCSMSIAVGFYPIQVVKHCILH
jgi:hypothetical protein